MPPLSFGARTATCGQPGRFPLAAFAPLQAAVLTGLAPQPFTGPFSPLLSLQV